MLTQAPSLNPRYLLCLSFPPLHACVISHLLEVLSPRSQYDFTDFNLRVFVGNLSSKDDTIVLSLCRFEKDANAECGGKPEGTLQYMCFCQAWGLRTGREFITLLVAIRPLPQRAAVPGWQEHSVKLSMHI